MLDITRGPSMKPAWAATKRRSASDRSVSVTNPMPTASPPYVTSPAKRSASTAFIVFPATGVTWASR